LRQIAATSAGTVPPASLTKRPPTPFVSPLTIGKACVHIASPLLSVGCLKHLGCERERNGGPALGRVLRPARADPRLGRTPQRQGSGSGWRAPQESNHIHREVESYDAPAVILSPQHATQAMPPLSTGTQHRAAKPATHLRPEAHRDLALARGRPRLIRSRALHGHQRPHGRPHLRPPRLRIRARRATAPRRVGRECATGPRGTRRVNSDKPLNHAV
jgi:hypothetical protein